MDLLPPQLIIDRLKAEIPRATIAEVGGLAELGDAASLNLRPAASAFVFPAGARAIEIREGSGPLRQDFDVTVSVLTAVGLAGPRGEEGLKKLAAPTRAVRLALWGWQPAGVLFPFVSGDEALEEFDGDRKVALYRQDFTTRVRLVAPLES